MVQIDHMSVAIEAGFAVKESEAVCPVSKPCCMRACMRATATCTSKLLDRPVCQAPFVLPPKSPKYNGCVERANAELAKFEHF